MQRPASCCGRFWRYRKLLRASDPHARTAAARVLCYWRDRVPDALALLKTQADDENARVRLEAVRAASFFNSTEAVEVALTVLKHPTDYYLDYTLRETLRELRAWSRKARRRRDSFRPPVRTSACQVSLRMRPRT